MSFYVKSPFKAPVVLAVAGTPTYLFGSWNDKTGPTQGFVISDASNGTTTGTLVFQIVSGNVPVSGSLITVVGTGNGAGNFNVTNVAATVVSTTEQGVCTVTYTIASTATPTTQTQDFGSVIIPQPEVGDSIPSGTPTASVPVASPYNNAENNQGKSITVTLNLPTGGTLSAIAAALQGANIDLDSEYSNITTIVASGSAGHVYTWQSGQDTPAAAGNANAGGVNALNFRFYRLNLSAVTGAGLAIGKIEF